MFDFIAKLIKGDRSRSSAGSGDAARQGEAPPARGELDAAEDSFRRALAKDPNDIVACAGLGAALCEGQRHEEAEPLLRHALALDPRHRNAPEAHRLLGAVLNSRGDRQGAIDHLTEALQQEVGPEIAYRDLCLLLFQSGQVERATAVARKGVSAYPGSADLQTYLGNLLGYAGDHRGADACYRRALSIGPATAELHFNFAIVLGKQGAFEQALASYRRAIELTPAFPAAHLNLGNVLQHLGRPGEALAHYEHATRLAPDLVDAHLGAANAHQAAGHPDLSLACCERVLAIRPDDVRAHILVATILLGKGMTDEALASYGRAVRIKPDDVDGILGLGNALLQRGDREGALARYREVLQLDPANGVAHLIAALTGVDPDRAPDRYVAKLFDDYADRFDSHLVQVLRYDIPAKIANLLGPHSDPSRARWDVLDLGCGTGLVGAAIAPYTRTLVGVDLSPGMLAKARAGGRYARLEQSDLHAMMQREPSASYDLVTAADVFVYVGMLDDIVREAARVLRPGGLFAFSVESLDALASGAAAGDERSGFRLNPTGRYAHSIAYLRRLAADHGFRILETRDTHGRIDKGKPVDAYLTLWRHSDAPAPTTIGPVDP